MRKNTYRSYVLSNKNPKIFDKVKVLQIQLNVLTESNREKYCLHFSKITDTYASAKTYRLTLKNAVKQQINYFYICLSWE